MSQCTSYLKLFKYYQDLGQKAMDQVDNAGLLFAPDDRSNSIAVIVKHLHGNMRSRWTDFLTSDGEKTWRDRDDEFVHSLEDRAAIYRAYSDGWDIVFDAIRPLTDENLDRIVYIRNEGHTVQEAIHRQLAHYAYHIGQIVYIARWQSKEWESLSIPRGSSESYNADKMSTGPRRQHFTEDI